MICAGCAAVALVGLAAPPPVAATARLRVPGPVGTVDTVAGPGFCTGPATPAPGSGAVGAVAADAAGTVWFESGEVGEGLVTRVLNSASVLLERTGGTALGTAGREGRGDATSRLAAAATLVPDGSGGVLMARPTAILQLANGLTTLAGTTSPPPGGEPAGASMGDGGPVGASRFSHVAAIATDGSGNVYVADELDRRAATVAIRFLNRSQDPVTFYAGTQRQLTVAPGTVGTIAGGSEGGGQPARSGLVAIAPVLAVAGGRVYLASTLPGARPRGVVRVLNVSGEEQVVHGATVASGALAQVAVVSGSDLGRAGPGSLRVAALPGIAVDGQGNLFLADPANHRVLRLDPAGSIATVAGTGASGFNGNDRPAVQTRLHRPYDVEVGPGGRLYISDAGNEQVRFVDSGGLIRAGLGNGAAARWRCGRAGGTDDSMASDASQAGLPVSVAADSAGNAFVVTGLGQVHRLTPSGALRPVVGRPAAPCRDPAGCPPREGARAASSSVPGLAAVALGPAGGVYVQGEGRIRFANLGRRAARVHGVPVAPGTIATVAGGGPAGSQPTPSNEAPAPGGSSPGDDHGRALAATIADEVTRLGPVGALAADRKGNVLIADSPNGRVRQVDAQGTITTLLGGNRPAAAPSAASRCCLGPSGLALDPAGNVYVADRGGRVWFLNRGPKGVVAHGVPVGPGRVEAVAGRAGSDSGEEGRRALETQLPVPWGVALDGGGNLYVSTLGDHSVRRVDPTGAITTVAGTGQRGFNGDGLKGALTALDRPTQIAVDACGNLLVADFGNDRVRRLNLVTACTAGATASATSRPSALISAAVVAFAAAVAAAAWRRARRGRGSGGHGDRRRSAT